MRSNKLAETSIINSQLQKTPIAIIGMASIFPKSRNLQEYWENILKKIDCITDVPPSRWKINDYYDPDPAIPDKTYCKRGGFIPNIDFNPLDFGIPPNIIEVTDISQLLALVVAKETMEDAGYREPHDSIRERTGVILGVVGGSMQLLVPLTTRLQYPVWEKVLKSYGLSNKETQKIINKIKLAYVGWAENSFPGWLANVIAGRIANRLDLRGINCVVDAACASSLCAVKMALSQLTEYQCDMVLTGGIDTDNSILTYMSFSKTPAFSKKQHIRPFDADADGMIPGEGIGMVLLKRFEDAERDCDKIYAVIKGIGSSSDGKYKSIYAPRWEGQVMAIHRAYDNAGFPASSIGMMEAHGTGTLAGDLCEFTALNQAFNKINYKKQHIALGSVKSQIGHTKAASGAASLIKTALALHHKILPPTINVTKPNPQLKIETSPFYLNTEVRPWIRGEGEAPRRAGVSSFGFGGTNYHVVLEEYKSEHDQAYRLNRLPQALLLFAQRPEKLLKQCKVVLDQLQSEQGNKHYKRLIDSSESLEIPINSSRVGFVTNSLQEACILLRIFIDTLRNRIHEEEWEHPQGIYYRKKALNPDGKVVALFSGQGSQYIEMGRDLVLNFPELRQTYSYIDSLFSKENLEIVSNIVFPLPVFEPEQKYTQQKALQRTEYAQAAIGAFSVGLYKIFRQAGFKPDFVAGHSFGELTALWAAEVMDDEQYFTLVKARGKAMASPDQSDFDGGSMLAVTANINEVKQLVKNFQQLTIANFNSHSQVVLAGAKSEIAKIKEYLIAQGYTATLLSVSAAFHTSFVKYAQQPFAQAIRATTFNEPKIPIYSNATGKTYPTEPEAIQQNLEQHILKSVNFKDEIEHIYAAGGYFFIEFGPKGIITNLVKDILVNRPHLAVALNPSSKKASDQQLLEAVVQLRVAGLSLQYVDRYKSSRQDCFSKTKSVLNISLNGSNYVSEKTITTFEKALQNEHQVKSLVSSSEATLAIQSISPSSDDGHQTKALLDKDQVKILATQKKINSQDNKLVVSAMIKKSQFFAQNKSLTMNQISTHSQKSKNVPSVVESKMIRLQHTPSQPLSYQQRVLESIEHNLTQFIEHQSDTLTVLAQYLNNQAEYAKSFLQLMQQYYVFLDQSHTIPATNGKINHNSVEVPQNQSTQEILEQENTLVSENHNSVEVSQNQSTQEILEQENTLVSENHNSVEVSQNQSTQEILEQENTLVSEPSSTSNSTTLSQLLLEVISDKTGYPVEMLEMEMDMETDLGIDSIKRVEILAALQNLLPEIPKMHQEDMAELRTLNQIIKYIEAKTSTEKKNQE